MVIIIFHTPYNCGSRLQQNSLHVGRGSHLLNAEIVCSIKF